MRLIGSRSGIVPLVIYQEGANLGDFRKQDPIQNQISRAQIDQAILELQNLVNTITNQADFSGQAYSYDNVTLQRWHFDHIHNLGVAQTVSTRS